MIRPDVPGREKSGDRDDVLQFLNETEKTRRLKKRALLDALHRGGGNADDEQTPNKNESLGFRV